MEWRIIVPVLCLIGLLHLPGSVVAQGNGTNSTLNGTNSTASGGNSTGIVGNSSAPTGNPSAPAGNSSAPAGNSSAPAGNSSAPAGNSPASTGNSTASGGNSTAPAGNSTATGGNSSAGGGNSTATGGNSTATGGNSAAGGGNSTATGGNSTATGGNSTGSGGNSTATGTTVGPPPPKVAKVNMVFKMNQNWNAVYSDLTNSQTITLINQVTSQFVVVYRQRYKNFYRMVINKFSQGSVVADTNLEFDSTNGTSPNATDVKDTLVQAVASGNLNLSVDTTNITTSAVPDSTTNGTNTTTTNTTSATTVAQVTTLSTTTVASQMNYSLTFKMTGLFVNDLSNSSSVAYGLMSTLVRSQLDGYFGKFTGYFNSFIRGFRSGSIIVDAGLSFNSSSNTANASTLAKSMASAVRNGSFALLIDPTSINVTDSSGYTASNSPVLASMLTAVWMTMASLLLSAVIH